MKGIPHRSAFFVVIVLAMVQKCNRLHERDDAGFLSML
jgi:hypothetical protein